MRKRIFYVQYLRCVALLLSLALISSVLTAPTFAYIVTQTSSLLNTFISGLDPEGGIIIRKTVEHPFGKDYVIPEHIAFDFRVELGEEYAGKTMRTTQGGMTADSDGNLTVTIKPGESVGIADIVAGTNVTVTELTQSPGFTIPEEDVSQTVTITARENTTVHFVNTYTPASVSDVNLEVTGLKNLEGRPWLDGDSFTFCLEYRYVGEDNSRWMQLGTATVTYDPAVEDFNCFDLTRLVQAVDFNKYGTYSFRVSEMEGVIGGITYDELVSYFDVQVSDADMDGSLEFANVTGTAGAEVVWDDARTAYFVTMTFSNRYAPTGSAAVSIPIRKTVEDRSGQNHTAGGFTFGLYTPEGELLQTSEPTSASGETGLRLVYDAAQAGQTFTYIIKETNAGTVDGAIIYDATEYTVQVTVTDNLDGTIRAEADVQELSFVNVYDPQDATVYFEGTKTLEGRDLREWEFSFLLYPVDSGFAKGEDVQPIGVVSNRADGSFSFGPLTYDRVGTYYYIVCEDASQPLGGVSYDDTVYHLTVSVTDEDGVLTAQTGITTPDGQGAELCYHNTYRPIAALLQLGGRKVLQGADLKKGQFHFKLYAADESFVPEEQALQTVSNAADGNFRFEALRYEQEGIYRYIIREEIIEPIEGIIYDDSVYAVTVTVTDDGNGALVTKTDIKRIGGDTADEIVFENIYKPQTDPTPDDPDAPQTGDTLVMTPYVLMVVLSMTLFVMLRLWDKIDRLEKK